MKKIFPYLIITVVSLAAGAVIYFSASKNYSVPATNFKLNGTKPSEDENIILKDEGVIENENIIHGKIGKLSEPVKQKFGEVFSFAQKNPATKFYYSYNLSIGFTYLPQATLGTLMDVTEIENKIFLHPKNSRLEDGQMIQVFVKTPSLSLTEAINDYFLDGYTIGKCFAKQYEKLAFLPVGYVTGGISYPPSNNPDEPSWLNNQCPPAYSETNGVRYFMMNENEPGLFIFANGGQESPATDGILGEDGHYNYDWLASIRIIKFD